MWFLILPFKFGFLWKQSLRPRLGRRGFIWVVILGGRSEEIKWESGSLKDVFQVCCSRYPSSYKWSLWGAQKRSLKKCSWRSRRLEKWPTCSFLIWRKLLSVESVSAVLAMQAASAQKTLEHKAGRCWVGFVGVENNKLCLSYQTGLSLSLAVAQPSHKVACSVRTLGT